MKKIALFVKMKTKPGKREQVKRLWEELAKPHVEEDLDFCAFSYANDDDDTNISL